MSGARTLNSIAHRLLNIGDAACKHDALLARELYCIAQQVAKLEGKVEGYESALRRPDPLGEALNSGDGSYRP